MDDTDVIGPITVRSSEQVDAVRAWYADTTTERECREQIALAELERLPIVTPSAWGLQMWATWQAAVMAPQSGSELAPPPGNAPVRVARLTCPTSRPTSANARR
jgi:hypothetical protein